MKFRKLMASEIDVRVGSVYEGFFTLLPYKDARVDMDILDETVGCDKWQRRHYAVKENLYCSVGIKCGTEWAWKDDCGTESRVDGEGNEKKGEASDSFKRACVNWGIGRELYTSPFICIYCDCEKKQKSYELPFKDFKVSEVAYDGDVISKLVITAKEKKQVKEIFTFGVGRKPEKQDEAPPKFENMPIESIMKRASKVVAEALKAGIAPSISDDVVNDVYYQGSEAGYDQNKVDEVVNQLCGKLKVEDLTLAEANELIKKFKAKAEKANA